MVKFTLTWIACLVIAMIILANYGLSMYSIIGLIADGLICSFIARDTSANNSSTDNE